MGRRQGSEDAALVGRTHELRVLGQLLRDVSAGGSSAVALLGEPGIGKTRLLSELGERARAAGFTVLMGRGYELEPEIPFGLAVEALDGPVAALDPGARRRLGQERLAELGAVLPSLAGVETLPATSLEVERFRCYHAVHTVLEQLSHDHPVLLAFDDMHWADQASLELVAYLLRRGPRRCLLALTYRRQAPALLTGAVGRAAREGGLRSLKLGPLSTDETSELLGDGFSAAGRDVLHVESGGNPFYLEQLARAGHGGSDLLLRTQGPDANFDGDVPPVVQATIEQELVQLSPAARRLAHAAAVAGEPFDLDLALEIGGLDEPAGYKALDELIRVEVVVPTEVPGRSRFRHPIVRRAVYDAAGHGWRIRAHQRAAAALARRGALPAARAQHVVRSGAAVGDEEAITLLVEAGRAAASRAPGAAAHWFEGAVQLLPTDASAERRLSLLVPLATALSAIGRLRDARSVLSDALGLLPASETRVRGQVAVMIARIDQALGRGEEARRLLDAALAETEADSPDAGELTLELAKNHAMLREWDAAASAAARARTLAGILDDRELLVTATATSAFFHAWGAVGEIAAAHADIDEAASGLDKLADDDMTPGLLEALFSLIYAETNVERWAAAEAHANRGVRICRATGQGLRYLDFMRPLVSIRMLQGRLADAAQASDRVVEASHLLDNDQALTLSESSHCWLAVLQGQMSRAMASGENAVLAAERAPHSQLGWMAHLCYGMALVEAGQPEQGRLRILTAGGPELGDVPPAARPHWLKVLAEAELALGRIEAAKDMAQQAEALATRLDLPMRIGDARYARASVLLAQGEHDAGATVARQAVEAYDTSGVVIEAARSRLLVARALAQQGETTAAGAELEAAHAVFERCGAVRLTDRAAQELRRIGRRVARKPGRQELADAGPAALSHREREVAALASQGYTNRQIAEELFLSRKTVETHLAHIFAKLGVSSRTAMATALDASSTTNRRHGQPV